jgi:hypothetical protein
VHDLVLADLEELRERRLQPERVQGDLAAAGRRQGDDVVTAAVDGGETDIRQPERVRPAGQGHRVGQLVAQQRLELVAQGWSAAPCGRARRAAPTGRARRRPGRLEAAAEQLLLALVETGRHLAEPVDGRPAGWGCGRRRTAGGEGG